MHPLPLVSLILGLFVFCALALVGLIAADYAAAPAGLRDRAELP